MERTITKLLVLVFLVHCKYLCVKLQTQKHTNQFRASVPLKSKHKLLGVNVWMNKTQKNSYNSVHEL